MIRSRSWCSMGVEWLVTLREGGEGKTMMDDKCGTLMVAEVSHLENPPQLIRGNCNKVAKSPTNQN